MGFRKDEFFNRVVRQELKDRIGKIASPPSRLLDVGCGNGEFLTAASEHGYTCLGIDVSNDAVEIVKKAGLDAVTCNFLTHSFETKFRVITMWDVMEHLQKPQEFVERARELLEPDGVLILKIPSFGWLNFTILRGFPSKGSVLLGAPGHVQYFTRGSLARLLGRAGFVEAGWFANKKFRSKPPTKSWQRQISRTVQKFTAWVARNSNLYVFVTADGFSDRLRSSVHFNFVEKLKK